MTPFFDPHHIDQFDRPAMLRRRADAHRLARQAPPRAPRRRLFGAFGPHDGHDAA